jgi:hypothetical protein
MVIQTRGKNRVWRQQGMLATDIMIAMGIMVIALLPLSNSFLKEQQALRMIYQRALVMSIVDGEMERLVAGEWRGYTEGKHEYRVRAAARENLPGGKFVLQRDDRRLMLSWIPLKKGSGGRFSREVILP